MLNSKTEILNTYVDPSSFRDQDGHVFWHGEMPYRQINKSYKDSYCMLINSGLYNALTSENLLVHHEECSPIDVPSPYAYKVIKPKRIPFISYPYEWAFSALKDAALLTLKVLKISLEHGMILKDASAFNIQFLNGTPIFIDSLSFEPYLSGSPWGAYQQFCKHFIAPLALMCYNDVSLNQLLLLHIDGIPLNLASKLLPSSTRFKLSLLVHIHLHAKSLKKYSIPSQVKPNVLKKVSQPALLGLIDNLHSTVNKLKWKPQDTEWANYYSSTNYSTASFDHKKLLVSEYIDIINPSSLWDLGSNNGEFSRIATSKGIQTISFDYDAAAVEQNYLLSKKNNDSLILPLSCNIVSPSPSIGWASEERASLTSRGPAEMLLALALIHHLVISNNTPFDKVAKFFSEIGNSLIIEFIPKEDSQVQKLLSSRKDIFRSYSQGFFEHDFQGYFKIINSQKIQGSLRTLYLMKKIVTA